MKGDVLLLFVFLALGCQLLLIARTSPQALVEASQAEPEYLLQGKNPLPGPSETEELIPELAGMATAGEIPVMPGRDQPALDRMKLAVPGQVSSLGNIAPEPAAGEPEGMDRDAGGDPYREFLAGIALLEESDRYRLTPTQARHLLRLVEEVETLRSAMPQVREEILATLTPEQLDYLAARKSALGPTSRHVLSDRTDRYARQAMERLGENPKE